MGGMGEDPSGRLKAKYMMVFSNENEEGHLAKAAYMPRGGLDNTSLQIAPVLSSDKSMYNSGCRLFLSGITGRETGAFDYFKPVYSSFIVNCIRLRSRSMLSTFTVTC